MLKPFKSLLTYLQKGSPNSSGSYADEKDDEVDEASVEGSDALANGDHDDPLTDPLAFDHDYTSAVGMADGDLADHHKEATEAAYGHSLRASHHFGDDDIDEEGGDSSGEIVFVDINRLKAAPHSPHLLPPPPPPPPPPVTLPVSSSTLLCKGHNLPAVDAQFPREDRLRAGVEQPGTSSSTQAEDAEASRSDGSDSGLGSELLNVNHHHPAYEDTLPPTSLASHHPDLLTHGQLLPVPSGVANQDYDDLLSPSRAATRPSPSSPSHLVPPRSALKRASLDVAGEAVDSKRLRRTVQFDSVDIFYFARIQGFLCVPSVGGCTLGMEARHMYEKKMTLAEHLAEQRRTLRMRSEQMNPNLRRSQQHLQNQLNNNNQSNNQSNPQQQQPQQASSSDDSDEEASSASDVDAELTGFLRPVGTKQRRALLKSAGVRKIEASEKDECRVIRESREVCGCRCQGGYCDPELCYCSINNIKCQVDRPNFPCSCTGDCCGNRTGRVEFNPGRVRTHYIHTKMRLELEEKQQRLEGALGEQAKGVMRDIVDCGRRRRPFESPSSPASSYNNVVAAEQQQQAMDDLSAFAVPATLSSQSSLIQSRALSSLATDSVLRIDTEVMLDHQHAIPGESGSSSSLTILSRSSLADYRCRYESNHNNNNNNGGDYRDDGYYRGGGELGGEVLSSSGGGSGAVNKSNSNGGTGSQFCNNILQILGIQSTPTSPIANHNVNVTPPLIPETKDYSSRRLIRPVEEAEEEEDDNDKDDALYLSRQPLAEVGVASSSSQFDSTIKSGGEVPSLATVVGDTAANNILSSGGRDWPLRNSNSNSDDNDAAGHTNLAAN